MKLFKLLTTFSFFSLFSCFSAQPAYVRADDTLGNPIEPQKSLEIAEPYLQEHATYHWNKEKPMKTHIVLHRKWYYIQRTNYPAKTVRYYMQPAVRVNIKTGEVAIIKK